MVLAAYKAGGRQIKKKRLRLLPLLSVGQACDFFLLAAFVRQWLRRLAARRWQHLRPLYICSGAVRRPIYLGGDFAAAHAAPIICPRRRGGCGAPQNLPPPPPRLGRYRSIGASLKAGYAPAPTSQGLRPPFFPPCFLPLIFN